MAYVYGHVAHRTTNNAEDAETAEISFVAFCGLCDLCVDRHGAIPSCAPSLRGQTEGGAMQPAGGRRVVRVTTQALDGREDVSLQRLAETGVQLGIAEANR